ncbi:MAG: hypothetical protein EOP07_07000 [Proteobacteria bacterium]|nr:MAG: hypothetical protein EOP07_07000 [Pseudomonadota bacterium]RZA17755.1 MAG: hypothetical protein EOP10_22135 [Pseudomonadota bacterium]
MNFALIIGYLASFAVVFAALAMSLENVWIVFDVHSILLVLGGTIAITFACFPVGQVLKLIRVFFKDIIKQDRITPAQIITNIVSLSQARVQGKDAFKSAGELAKHPFLKESAAVLTWTEADISKEELREMLELRAETIFTTYSQDATIFKTIAKFPPAFGLMGTTMGMIALLQAIGKGESGSIGTSMSLALLATLYGLVFANLIFVPMAEYLSKKAKDDFVIRRMIIEAIMLIHERKPTKYVEEKAKSFLLPGQRDAKKA